MRPDPDTRWQTSPDALLNSQRKQFSQQRNQALWREEQWELAWEDWLEMWQPLWHLRGRSRHSLCMSRIDYSKPWRKDNVEVIPRGDHVRKQHRHKAYLKEQGLVY